LLRNGQHGKAVPDGNSFFEDSNEKATTADIGLTRKQIHEARRIRDAESKRC
jgi:hypothetical protein